MFDNELYIKTFSKLKAPENTLVEVVKLTTDRKTNLSRFNKPETDSGQRVQRRTIKRGAVIVVAVLLTLTLATTVLARGEDIITYLGNSIWGMAISEGYPVKGYALARRDGEFMQVEVKADGELIWNLHGYVFNPDRVNGKYTIEKVAYGNGEMIMIRPGDADGFSLKQGERMTLYALLNTEPKYAGKAGELSQVGCYHNGELYETFTGNLVSGGAVFTIEAPCDGEFIIYMINFCATLQNYVEISVY